VIRDIYIYFMFRPRLASPPIFQLLVSLQVTSSTSSFGLVLVVCRGADGKVDFPWDFVPLSPRHRNQESGGAGGVSVKLGVTVV